MSALNKSETEVLTQAEQVLTTVGSFLADLEKGEIDRARDEKYLKWLRNQVKSAFDGVRTVKTMKGYYPS